MTAQPSIRHRRHAARALLVLALATSVTGCSTIRGWFTSEEKAATKPAELVEFTETASPSRLWRASAGKGEGRTGVRQGPFIADGVVYAASVRGGVHAFDLQSGRRLWHHDSDLRFSGGPGAGDGLVVAGSLDGEVVALDASTGEERWTATLPNEVIARPTIGQGLVIVRSNDGRVTAFDAATGDQRWFWGQELPALTVRGNAPVALAPGHVFVGTDEGQLVALALADGRALWEQAVAIPDGRTELERMADVDGAPVVDGSTVFASSYRNRTMAFEGPTGRPLWSAESGGPGSVALADDRLVVSDAAGTVWGIDRYGGTSYWRQPALARRELSPAAVHGAYAVVGDVEGYLHWMRLADGEFAARERASRDPIAGHMAVADGVLVVQDIEGDLSAWRID